ncbi:MAG: tRNA pseudouridine(55) synthase TruB [Lawsonibacter sp.]|jgi:tRNA pseudouridine55 synthase
MATNGILVIDKPQDWTSMDVCAKLRGVFQEKRIGHAGTLDPMATGVLPVFLGRATRAVEFASEGEKEYLAGLMLGVTTNTQDTTGQILQQHSFSGSVQDLEDVLPAFRGNLLQIPPMYSAIKIGGKKLYELARKGREVERPPRPITIYDLSIEGQQGDGSFLLRIRCSKGTYVRTLCHDIGQALGCGGCMSSLRRTMAAGFSLEQAVTLDQILHAPDPSTLLLPVDTYFSHYPSLTLPVPEEKKIRNGMTLVMPQVPQGTYRVYGSGQVFLALGKVENGKLFTIKSFFPI